MTSGGIAFTVGAAVRLVHDGMAWRTAVFVMLPFAPAALSFGRIFHRQEGPRAGVVGRVWVRRVWVRSLWDVAVLAVVPVTRCSGK